MVQQIFPTVSNSWNAEPGYRLGPVDDGDWQERVTACITHWRRPYELKRLKASLSEKFPGMEILAEDTRGNISAGRQRLLDRCRTEYYLMLEEDFRAYCQTRLANLVDVLDHDPRIAVAAGWMDEPRLPGTVNRGGRYWWSRDFEVAGGRCYINHARRHWRTTLSGVRYLPCELVINFGIWRTDIFRQVPPDPNLPIHEHREWFWRLVRAGHLAAYVPSVGIQHLRTRPDDTYRQARGRNFSAYHRGKHGFIFVDGPRTKPVARKPTATRPNIVVLGVGCSNTSVTTRMIEALGWHNGRVNEYHEHRGVLAVNQRWQRSGVFDRRAGARQLATLRQPWVIKDPRFRDTLPLWQPLLKRYDPLLLYVTKDPEAILASLQKRGWRGGRELVANRIASANRHFAAWPGPKLHLAADQVAAAAALFDCDRYSIGLPAATRHGHTKHMPSVH